MICIRCGKEMPITTCTELAYISMEGNPYSYMPLCDECNKAFINFIDNAPTVDIKPFASFSFDKDELNRIVEERVIEPIKNGELVVKAEERPQDKQIEEIIEELESRKDYGVEYAEAMENVIVILKAKFV